VRAPGVMADRRKVARRPTVLHRMVEGTLGNYGVRPCACLYHERQWMFDHTTSLRRTPRLSLPDLYFSKQHPRYPKIGSRFQNKPVQSPVIATVRVLFIILPATSQDPCGHRKRVPKRFSISQVCWFYAKNLKRRGRMFLRIGLS
jgi:hypothetical protein